MLDALFLELHEAVEEAASGVVFKMAEAELAYPPGIELTKEEAAALSEIKLSDAARSGLKKLVTDTATIPLFRLFTLVDGVGDLTGFDGWYGTSLTPKGEEDEPMLHDKLFESYWQYTESLGK